MSVKNIQEVPQEIVKNGEKTVIQVLISPEQGPTFAMRRFVMQPGGGMPNHTNTLEHEQYVLAGQANVGIGKEIHKVKAGDVIFIPEGVPHWYQNTGDEDFEFLCIVPNKEDQIRIMEKEC